MQRQQTPADQERGGEADQDQRDAETGERYVLWALAFTTISFD